MGRKAWIMQFGEEVPWLQATITDRTIPARYDKKKILLQIFKLKISSILNQKIKRQIPSLSFLKAAVISSASCWLAKGGGVVCEIWCAIFRVWIGIEMALLSFFSLRISKG
jgi:hypothetical protein